jgi:hypothetical protein
LHPDLAAEFLKRIGFFPDFRKPRDFTFSKDMPGITRAAWQGGSASPFGSD